MHLDCHVCALCWVIHHATLCTLKQYQCRSNARSVSASSDIQTRSGADIPLDHLLARRHLLEQPRVADDARGVLDLPARLVEAGDDPDDGALEDVGEAGDLVEAHAAGPLVDDLDEAEAGPGDKVVAVVGGQDDLVLDLEVVDALGEVDDGLDAALERGGQRRHRVRLLLEHKARQQRDNLLGRKVRQRVLEDQLRQHQLVRRVDLARHLAFELHARARVDEAQVGQHADALAVVGQQLQVLVRHERAELRNVLSDEPFVVAHAELEARSQLRRISRTCMGREGSYVLDEIRALQAVGLLCRFGGLFSFSENFLHSHVSYTRPFVLVPCR